MISAILAAKALKKLRGGEMFTTGASPYNSAARQLYGGWTPEEARGNLWATRKAMAMRAKYGTNFEEVVAAKQWLQAYNKARKKMPTVMNAAMARARKALGLPNPIPYPLTDGQKEAILSYWESLPLTDKTRMGALKRALVSKAPYPPYGYLLAHPGFSNPAQATDPTVLAYASDVDAFYNKGYFDSMADRKAYLKRIGYNPIRVPRGRINPYSMDAYLRTKVGANDILNAIPTLRDRAASDRILATTLRNQARRAEEARQAAEALKKEEASDDMTDEVVEEALQQLETPTA